MNRNGNTPEPIRSAPTPEALEAAISSALSHKPAMSISPDFAARVARSALAQPLPRRARWVGWGPRLAIASGALLTVGMFALAPHATPSLTDLRFDAELVLFLELCGLLLFSGRLVSSD
ncbi:MAG TPA: hypothetical protein VKV02_02930 [Acidobacteriaceae bacterium]|nr:hypothetical protein [Acidobacteriaceae bacterium]